jgi:hypothetical protein
MTKHQNPILNQLRATLDYEIAGVEIDFTESLETLMARRGVSNDELARRTGKCPGEILDILQGGTELTLEAMVDLACALEGRLELRVDADPDNRCWFHAARPCVAAPRRIQPTDSFVPSREFRVDSTHRGFDTDLMMAG